MLFNPSSSLNSVIAENFSFVILNFCNNAFDAMREKLTGDGRPKTEEKSPLKTSKVLKTLEVSMTTNPKLTVRTKSENNKIQIKIEYNGPGIPDEIKDKILQPFFRTKKGTAGTGLGLSITNDNIKAHGGTIIIKTKEDEGSTFTIELPI